MAKKHAKSAKPKAPAKKPVLKKSPPAPMKAKPAKHAPPAKAIAAAKPAPAGKPVKNSPTMEKPSKKTALRDKLLKRKVAAKPIAFSLDEVRAIAKTVTSKTNIPFASKTAKGATAKPAT